ncbi:PIG-L family deacetylase [Subtercola lobariae]|uniref:N-acetyl-1-D-myo-inositol-2-amino-2-deoxy-alpha-D-glucopyranoside deacetylase n=1 Tax=Subtercola lobariae TaxID=1588641 RepID=A0A917EXX6_9MICO|nr:PIG-L family deacetylase [Subtercola lobariae]GGF28521.1 hypothetical protein GCM10011399_22110 [Subtercola lobariae]
MVFPGLDRRDSAATPGSVPGAAAAPTVLLLHAHPDDETLATGGLMARLVADGARVVLVTGTRGERGEVVPGPLKHLEGTPELAATRVFELAAAMRELGVIDHRFLGEVDARAEGLAPRSYLDSGMQWAPSGMAEAAADAPADALSLAPFDEVVADVLAVVAELRPQVIVSYDERGGYGHPDHVRMHDAAVAAVAAVAALGSVAALALVAAEAAAAVGAAVAAVPPFALPNETRIDLYTVIPDSAEAEDTDIVVPLGPYRDAKFRALAAHRTQLSVEGDEIVLSGGQRHAVSDAEVFRLYAGSEDSEPGHPAAESP